MWLTALFSSFFISLSETRSTAVNLQNKRCYITSTGKMQLTAFWNGVWQQLVPFPATSHISSILSITHPEPSLIHMSNLFNISSNESFKRYLWFITVFISELKWSVSGSNSLSLICFFRVILTLIIYLKPLFLLIIHQINFYVIFTYRQWIA